MAFLFEDRIGREFDPASIKALLLQGADPNTEVCVTERALHRAVEKNLPEAAPWLLDAGADPDFIHRGHCPLNLAAHQGRDRCVELLLNAGALVDGDPSPTSVTPLMAAASMKRKGSMQLLIAAGASLERTDANGFTPLIYAARHAPPEILMILLGAGADPLVKDRFGMSAEAHASAMGWEVNARLLRAMAEARELGEQMPKIRARASRPPSL